MKQQEVITTKREIDFQALETKAFERYNSMKQCVDEARDIVLDLEKHGFTGAHDATKGCTCKSCLIFSIAHSLKKCDEQKSNGK